jgi:hypothetical protein
MRNKGSQCHNPVRFWDTKHCGVQSKGSMSDSRPLLSGDLTSTPLSTTEKHIHNTAPYAQVCVCADLFVDLTVRKGRGCCDAVRGQFTAHPAKLERPSRRCAVMCAAIILVGIVGAILLYVGW